MKNAIIIGGHGVDLKLTNLQFVHKELNFIGFCENREHFIDMDEICLPVVWPETKDDCVFKRDNDLSTNEIIIYVGAKIYPEVKEMFPSIKVMLAEPLEFTFKERDNIDFYIPRPAKEFRPNWDKINNVQKKYRKQTNRKTKKRK